MSKIVFSKMFKTKLHIAERWADVSKRIRLDVEIQELEDGTYQPVELTKHHDDSCGGVFQLRAGMSRRILVSTKTIQVS